MIEDKELKRGLSLPIAIFIIVGIPESVSLEE